MSSEHEFIEKKAAAFELKSLYEKGNYLCMAGLILLVFTAVPVFQFYAIAAGIFVFGLGLFYIKQKVAYFNKKYFFDKPVIDESKGFKSAA